MSDNPHTVIVHSAPRFWELRWVGRLFGGTLLSGGLAGAVFAFFKFTKRDEETRRYGSYVGCTVLAITGIWFLTKRYWNDPQERAEERERFMKGNFLEFYREHGWDKLLHIVGDHQEISAKFAKDIEGKGLFYLWNEYLKSEGNNQQRIKCVDELLQHNIVSHNDLLIRFNQDLELTGGSAIERMSAYGPWAVDTLKVPPQTVYNALENCQTTKSMNFLTLNKYNIHILWKRKLISNDFVRYACLTELKNNWLRVQTRCGTWWLDHHLVQTEEVQGYFDEAWKKEEDLERFLEEYWEWPISKHSALLPNFMFEGLSTIQRDYTYRKKDYETNRKRIEDIYNKIEQKAAAELKTRKNDIEAEWEKQKRHIRSVYSNDETKYSVRVATEEKSVEKQRANAQKTYDNAVEGPKSTRDFDLEKLKDAHEIIMSQIRTNYDRLRMNGEKPQPIIDLRNQNSGYHPTVIQQAAPTVVVNIVNNK